MATATWKQAINGDWSVAANWSTGAVPTAADDAIINLIGNYTVSITAADTAASLIVDAPGARLVESAGSLTLGGGGLTIESSFVELDVANTVGGLALLDGGLLSLGNADALGGADLEIIAGEFLGTTDETIADRLFLQTGASTIAAASGTTLTLNSPTTWVIAPDVNLTFGAPGDDGVVVWRNIGTVVDVGAHSQTIEVQAGTLQGGDLGLGELLGNAGGTTVDFGATVDLAGANATINDLTGSGTVTNSGAAATLSLTAQDPTPVFAGRITGALSLDILAPISPGSDVFLTGNNTYSGTTTLETGSTLIVGAGGAAGTLGPGAVILNANTNLEIFHNDNVTLVNAISGAGVLTLRGSGATTINTANSFSGGTQIASGMLAVGNGGALGSGALVITNGTLLGTTNETLTNQLAFINPGLHAIAAATGTTLDLNGATGWVVSIAAELRFGAAGKTGTIVWHTPAGSTITQGAVHVVAGTLKAGDTAFGLLLDGAISTTVDVGATIDLGGFSTGIFALDGGGVVTNSGAGGITLNLDGGISTFTGSITGALSLHLASASTLTLTGANSYTGTTTIDAGSVLFLGDGLAGGSIGDGPIVLQGSLFIDRSSAVTLANAISGAGLLEQSGPGTTTINTANSYSGGTTISAGTLAIGNPGAIGSGMLSMIGGEFLGTVDETISNFLNLSGDVTMAAAHGTTLAMSAGGWSLAESAGQTVSFGAAGQDGTVIWSVGGGAIIQSPDLAGVQVQAGTLKGSGDSGLNILLSNVASTTVDSGATIDLAGFSTLIPVLGGSGTVTNSGVGVTLFLFDADFAGRLSGSLSLNVSGNSTLSGTSIVTGATALGTNAVLTNAGVFDITTDTGITVADSSTAVINSGLFEKTNGAGTSIVSAPFTNTGEVLASSGEIEFTGGFTNLGFVKGVLTGVAGVWTVARNAPGQTTYFGGSGDSHITVVTAPTYADGGAGHDTLELRASMTLAAGSLIRIETVQVDNGFTADLSHLTVPETIVLASTAGGGASVAGTQGNDTITGGAGNDTINGGLGADRMTGGAGNDAFLVDNPNDLVIEAANGGSDRVLSSVSFALGAGQSVEILNPTSFGSTTDINLTGNALAQTITGNAGDNVLNDGGAGGADTLSGLGGNDAYIVNNASDLVLEIAGAGNDRVLTSVSYTLTAGAEIENFNPTSFTGTTAINLTGNTFAQTIIGNAGANVINGAGGNDTLEGLGGNDTFVFNTALNAATNVDTILDFAHGADKIELDHAIFTALTAANPLPAADFTTGTPTNTSQHIIYNATTGALSYDDDGNGAHAAVAFAVLSGHPTLTNTDIFVV